MTHADFVHLRVHSAYSLSEGALRIGEAIGLAAQHEMPALAITDTGNLFGSLEFSFAAAAAGVQPIVGLEVAVSRGDAEGHRGWRMQVPDSLVLLAQDETGYRNLMRLSTAGFLETTPPDNPQVSWELLARHTDGLLALTGGVSGPLGRLILEGRDARADAVLHRLAEMFPGRLYVEIQRHGLDAENRVETGLLRLAYAHNVPLVATNEVYFANTGMYEAHDALLCIAGGTSVSDPDRRRVTPEHCFRSAAEMREEFRDLPEATANTLAVARRCAYRPPRREPILPPFPVAKGRTAGHELEARARAGLGARLAGLSDARIHPYRERLAYELGVIADMGFAGYFLVVADFIRFAHEAGIPVGPGRGSGAGSVVAWALRITDLDPLRFGLLFERFLNPHRVSMPDFDIDFCQERRDEVIQYVQQQYGADRVAQIITFGTLQARAALRDVGRVLEIPYGHVDRLSKMVPYNPAQPVTLTEAIAAEPRLSAEAKSSERVTLMLEIAQKLEGLYRHASTHAAGLVIGDQPLTQLVPLYRDARSEMPVTQFSWKLVEQAGLVKFDFLGLKTLTVLDKAIKIIADRGVVVDLASLPLDDSLTYDMLSRGDTVGVFQLESSGMRDLVREVQPGGIEDLTAIVALYRPGPMENIPKYVSCKHGREEPEKLHQLIEPVVADTYGVIIYQEQVMQIAQVFAGFSMAEADMLRRAMGKKVRSEMEALRDRFIAGAQAKGVSADRARHVFDLVDKFAGYGFNKAHSVGYAVLAFRTAYLKAHYPVEFLAASMTVDMGNTDKLSVFRDEASRLGIDVLPPDLNRSNAEFAVEEEGSNRHAIRYGLGAIRNVGAKAMASLVEERQTHGAYRSLADFAERIDPRGFGRRPIENLARAGAFDDLHGNRAEVVGAVETMLQHASAATAARDDGQVSMFGNTESRPLFEIPTREPWTTAEILQHELDVVGFYLSAHPLEVYATVLAASSVVPVAQIPEQARAGVSSLLLAGSVIRKRERRSARGSRFAYVTLSDMSGQFEVVVFAEQLASAREILEPGTCVLVTAEVRHEADGVRISAQRIETLDAVAARRAITLELALADAAPVADIRRILSQGSDGRACVSILVRPKAGGEIEIDLPGKYSVSPSLREALAHMPGILDVRER